MFSVSSLPFEQQACVILFSFLLCMMMSFVFAYRMILNKSSQWCSCFECKCFNKCKRICCCGCFCCRRFASTLNEYLISDDDDDDEEMTELRKGVREDTEKEKQAKENEKKAQESDKKMMQQFMDEL